MDFYIDHYSFGTGFETDLEELTKKINSVAERTSGVFYSYHVYVNTHFHEGIVFTSKKVSIETANFYLQKRLDFINTQDD